MTVPFEPFTVFTRRDDAADYLARLAIALKLVGIAVKNPTVHDVACGLHIAAHGVKLVHGPLYGKGDFFDGRAIRPAGYRVFDNACEVMGSLHAAVIHETREALGLPNDKAPVQTHDEGVYQVAAEAVRATERCGHAAGCAVHQIADALLRDDQKQVRRILARIKPRGDFYDLILQADDDQDTLYCSDVSDADKAAIHAKRQASEKDDAFCFRAVSIDTSAPADTATTPYPNSFA
jgi:hypothetical protein